MKMRRLAALLLALVMLLTLAACGKDQTEEPQQSEEPVAEDLPVEYPVELRGTIIKEEPVGVVSLSPALTELMQEMGTGGVLEGVSDYCDSGLPKCGTPQSVNFEAIEESGANLVVTSVELADADLTRLLQMDVDVLVLPRAGSLEELETLYLDLGRAVMGDITGREMGANLWNSFADRMAVLEERGQEYADTLESPPTVIFLRMLDYTMATGDTFEHRLLEKMGFKNLAESYGDWNFPKDNAAQLAPTLIISDDAITIPVLEKNEVYKGTQAVIKDQVVTVDMEAFERQTPRLLDELERVADFLFDGVVEARSAQDGGETI